MNKAGVIIRAVDALMIAGTENTVTTLLARQSGRLDSNQRPPEPHPAGSFRASPNIVKSPIL